MSKYLRTTQRRYMWGIATVCALFAFAIIVSDLLSERFHLTFRILGSEHTFQITRSMHPVLFWSAASVLATIALTAVIISSRGLSRVQRDEAKDAS